MSKNDEKNYKVKLNFSSRMVPSKKPVAVINKKPAYHLQRKTTVLVSILDDKNVIITERYGVVTCNHSDRDVPALGQKFAVAAALQNSSIAMSKKMKDLVWDAFRSHSKAAANVMNGD